MVIFFFFFKQKTAYEMRISDWSSDVCSSDLKGGCNVVDYIHFQATVSLVKYNELRLLMQPVALGPEHGGVAGLIVMQVSEGEYVAFDRCSTVNPKKRCAVEMEGEGPVAVDPCSGTKFLLTKGDRKSTRL